MQELRAPRGNSSRNHKMWGLGLLWVLSRISRLPRLRLSQELSVPGQPQPSSQRSQKDINLPSLRIPSLKNPKP